MKAWIYSKALRLYNEKNINYEFIDREGNVYFSVLDEESEVDEHTVKVSEGLSCFCDCFHGVTDGVNGNRCPHKLAVDLFVFFEFIEGDLSRSYVFKKGDREEREIDEVSADNELSKREKKCLRDMLSCEICGSNDDMNLHRINRKGLYVLRNIMPICGSCHRKIHSHEEGHTSK